MTFDPFGDFATRGYLRNTAGLHDPRAVKEFEHRAFLAKLDQAFAELVRRRRLGYRDILNIHKTLFSAVYPWAGQDRTRTSPDIAVARGEVMFAHPRDARAAVEYALGLGSDKPTMAAKPGEVMGYLAYAHPFLDGNGRTIMVAHCELAHRASISIAWGETDKTAYLTALTRELDIPGRGHLDLYLKPFVREALDHDQLTGLVSGTRGLDGEPGQRAGDDQILGRFSEPALQARYRLQQDRRRG